MKPFARILGLGILVLAGLGLFHVVANPPDLQAALPSFSLPVIDNRPRLTVNQGMRMTFDYPTSWDIASTSNAEVWWCSGASQLIEGPARVDEVCALALYDK